jgi:hypothetical protein
MDDSNRRASEHETIDFARGGVALGQNQSREVFLFIIGKSKNTLFVITI